MNVLTVYLQRHNLNPAELFEKTKVEEKDLHQTRVMDYPEDVIRMIARRLRKYPSIVLMELLKIEHPGAISMAVSDYGLVTAIENKMAYIFIPKNYRKIQSKFLQDVLIEKRIFQLEMGWITRINIIGKFIYETFLSLMPKSEEFERVESILESYEVKAHDEGGSLLYFIGPANQYRTR